MFDKQFEKIQDLSCTLFDSSKHKYGREFLCSGLNKLLFREEVIDLRFDIHSFNDENGYWNINTSLLVLIRENGQLELSVIEFEMGEGGIKHDDNIFVFRVRPPYYEPCVIEEVLKSVKRPSEKQRNIMSKMAIGNLPVHDFFLKALDDRKETFNSKEQIKAKMRILEMIGVEHD